MRIKLDENLPAALTTDLSQLGHNVDSVFTESLKGRPDKEIWNAAQQAERFLITQDLDFSDVRRYPPKEHPGVLIIRLRDPGRTALAARVLSIFETEPVEQWSGCIAVATARKIRVRRPDSD